MQQSQNEKALFRSRWVKCIAIAFGIILIILLFFGGPGDTHPQRSIKLMWDLGHIVLYFMLTAVILNSLPRGMAFHTLVAAMAGFALVSGILIEAIQHEIHRTASMGDVLRDLWGTGLALFFTNPGLKNTSVFPIRIVKVGLVFITLAIGTPWLVALYDEYRSRVDFPVLADFEHASEITRWQGGRIERSRDYSIHGEYSLKVTFNKSEYSGVEFRYPARNWSEYRLLQFGIYNPDAKAYRLSIRIHDLNHENSKQDYQDRYNHKFSIQSGWNTVSIPLMDVAQAPEGRKLDLSEIASLILFLTNVKISEILYFDYFRLASTAIETDEKGTSDFGFA